VEPRRAVWFRLRQDHPAVDPKDPSDDFAQAVLAAAGMDPLVWETGTETEALRAYNRALTVVLPDHTWAADLIDQDPVIAVEASVCVDMGISHAQFLTWPEASQDLAIATVLARRDLCPAGKHPRAAMTDPDAVTITRAYCAACAHEHHLEEQYHDAPPDLRVGWALEVTRVPR